jgi:hypothetical protein
MTHTAISIIQKAADLGLKLELKPPDTLTVESTKPWPRDFAETLQDYKPQLLTLLRLRFRMVYSELLQETIFFAEDEATKAALVKAGADEWSIYTRAELQILVEHNRASPFIPDELLRLHASKQQFNGNVTNS